MNKKMKVIKGIIIVLFLITIVLTIAIIYLINKSEKNNENFNYNDENITRDYDSGRVFINNEVLIFFNSNVEESSCEEIIYEISGKNIAPIVEKFYIVEVNYKFTTYSEIEEYGEMLKEQYDEIESVYANMIMPMDDPN